MQTQKIINTGLTTIRQFPLKDGRIAQLKQTSGFEPEFDVMVKKLDPATKEFVYKKLSEWQNGVHKLSETLQTYLTPNIDKNTMKYSDKFVLKNSPKETVIFIKNYFYDTVKIIRRLKDSHGKLIQKDVITCQPPLGIENLKPSKPQLDDFFSASLSPIDKISTRFRDEKPLELDRTIRRSYAFKKIKEGDKHLNRALNIEKLVNGHNENYASPYLFLKYYENGIPLLTNVKII